MGVDWFSLGARTHNGVLENVFKISQITFNKRLMTDLNINMLGNLVTSGCPLFQDFGCVFVTFDRSTNHIRRTGWSSGV